MFFNTLTVLTSLLTSTALTAPISLTGLAADDFATNVVMTSGASQFAMWVPTDGVDYLLSTLTCLNILSSSFGACSYAAIDQIAAISGYTCAFYGSNGWSGSQVGTDSSGWLPVSPPQTLTDAICVAN